MAYGNAEINPHRPMPSASKNSSMGHEERSSEDNRSFYRLLHKNPLLLYTMVLNPVLVLHSINGFLSLLWPDVNSYSTFDTAVQPHFDVHAQDGFCRLFTVVLVALQSVLYSSHAGYGVSPDSKPEERHDGHFDT
ncbi:hypothetical protein CLCR_00729 [Cladophialophora carrionii]|uniref:Uncharacterized protein n=1 Tax=Cladophialophora carrionii TaxID=86049 RepID=A0A1C1C6S1_9EURO|nr:hypothetical protein CLCR_00729 [Cladophialophora carrionii]